MRPRALALTIALLCSAPAAALEVGQSLPDALRELSAKHDLAIVFSAELVPDRLKVGRLPPRPTPTRLRDALLAEHGLRCRMLHRRCVVERATPSPAPEPEATSPAANKTVLLDQVSVVPSHYRLMADGASFLSREEIAATPHLADDVLRLIRNVPGVAASDLSAPFHVRGGQTDEVALQLDGLELYRPYHLQNLLNALGVVDSHLIGSIDLYTGAWPSRFGGRMSAIMDIRSRGVGAEPLRQAGLSSINAYYTQGQSSVDGEHEWLASARRGYLDIVLDLINDEGDIDPGYYDVFARSSHRIGDAHNLSFNLFWAGDDARYSAPDELGYSDGRADARYLWTRWHSQWNDQFSSETLLALTGLDQRREGFSVDRGESDGRIDERRELRGWRLQQQLSYDFDEQRSLGAGFEWRDERSDYDHRSDIVRYSLFGQPLFRRIINLDDDVEGELAAVWVDGQLPLGRSLQLRGGLRASRYAVAGRSDHVLDPHLALTWEATPDRQFRLAWGRASQGQRSDELDIGDGETEFFGPEQAEHRVLAWQERFGPRFGFRVELFDKSWRDLRPRYENLFDPNELFPEAEPDRVRIDADRAYARGIELELKAYHGDSAWWARYAYAKARERVDGIWQSRSWEQPHTLQLGASRGWSGGWQLTAQVDARSGWPTTPVSLEQTADGRVVPVLGLRNSDRLGSYLAVSARLSRDLPTRYGVFSWYLEVFNLFDRYNEISVVDFDVFRDRDGQLQVRRIATDGLPFLPSFGVRWSF